MKDLSKAIEAINVVANEHFPNGRLDWVSSKSYLLQSGFSEDISKELQLKLDDERTQLEMLRISVKRGKNFIAGGVLIILGALTMSIATSLSQTTHIVVATGLLVFGLGMLVMGYSMFRQANESMTELKSRRSLWIHKFMKV